MMGHPSRLMPVMHLLLKFSKLSRKSEKIRIFLAILGLSFSSLMALALLSGQSLLLSTLLCCHVVQTYFPVGLGLKSLACRLALAG